MNAIDEILNRPAILRLQIQPGKVNLQSTETEDGKIVKRLHQFSVAELRGYSGGRRQDADLLIVDSIEFLRKAFETRKEFDQIATQYLNIRIEIAEVARLNDLAKKEVAHRSYVEESARQRTIEASAVISALGSMKEIILQRRGHLDSILADHPNPGDDDGRKMSSFQFKRDKSMEIALCIFELQENDHRTFAANAAKLSAEEIYQSELAATNRLKERLQIASDSLARRISAFFKEDSVLNLETHLDFLRMKFLTEFAAGWSRLNIGLEGLKLIFGYTPGGSAISSGMVSFDKALLIAQSAGSWLGLNQIPFDHGFVRSFSLKTLLGIKLFNESKKDLRWRFSFTEGHFLNSSQIRLRGIGLTPHAGGKPSLWNATVHTPLHSAYVDPLGKVSWIKKTGGTPFWIGGIKERSQQAITISRSAAFYNASPLGDWKVELDGSAGGGWCNQIPDLDDLDIHLEIVGRQSATQG